MSISGSNSCSSAAGQNCADQLLAFIAEICAEIFKSEHFLHIEHSQYLGLPLMMGQKKQDVFKFIEEKSHKRLLDWKSKLLSSAGKETLIKAVFQAIPQYSMLCYKLPLSSCNRLVKLLLRFWWGNGKDASSVHWVKQQVLFNSKNNGGLGFRRPATMNDALLLKQAWRIMTEPELLVSRVYKDRYFRNSSLQSASISSRPSHAWRSIFKVKHHLLNGIEWLEGDHKPIWKHSGCGEFTTKSAYTLLYESGFDSSLIKGDSSNSAPMRDFWTTLWKLKLPGKIKIFGWRFFYNSLPDASNLRKRGIHGSPNCVFCGWPSESSCHLFRDCWWAKAIGERLKIPEWVFLLTNGSPADWLFRCAKDLSRNEFRTLICGAWCIWTSRNAIHHGKDPWSIDLIFAKVLSITRQWDKYVTSSQQYASTDLAAPDCIFCDGSWMRCSSVAGLAAVYLKNQVVHELSASHKPGVRSARDAEGEALSLGFELASQLGLSSVTFFSDSMEVVRAMFSGMTPGIVQPAWLSAALLVLSSHKGWRVEHCMREDNAKADAIAKFSRLKLWNWNVRGALPRIDPLSS